MHGAETDSALHAGLKRLLCHDSKCDTFKSLKCVKCTDNVVDNVDQTDVDPDDSDIENCITDALGTNGAIDSEYQCDLNGADAVHFAMETVGF